MTIWFTSDHHFGHQNILEYTDRPWLTITEHDEGIIERYNSKVEQGDVVYFVGDVFFCSQGRAKDIVSRLKGTKILIRGNHDKTKPNYYYSCGFDVVLEQAVIKIGKQYVHLSHYPFKLPWYKLIYLYLFNKKHRDYKRMKYRNIAEDGKYLLHGHTHSSKILNGKAIHIGLDAWDCYPVPAYKISEIIDRAENENK